MLEFQVVHDNEWEDREVQTDASIFAKLKQQTNQNGTDVNGWSKQLVSTVETQTYKITPTTGCMNTINAHAQTDQRILFSDKKTHNDIKVLEPIL